MYDYTQQCNADSTCSECGAVVVGGCCAECSKRDQARGVNMKLGSRVQFVFVRTYGHMMGIDMPIIALWTATGHNVAGAEKQYPGNTVLAYARYYDDAKVLARQWFHTR